MYLAKPNPLAGANRYNIYSVKDMTDTTNKVQKIPILENENITKAEMQGWIDVIQEKIGAITAAGG